MMSEEDLKEYHSIERNMRGIKKSNKYNYLEGNNGKSI